MCLPSNFSFICIYIFHCIISFFFFFQAEDGIRDADVTGVQTCALPIGADKVSVNSAAVRNPDLLTQGARRFGSQCIVLAIDARRIPAADGQEPAWEVVIGGGRVDTGLDAVEWARRGVELGAGEILLTSIDRDGTRDGYDLELTRRITEAVSVPVIASGGAGEPRHFRDVLVEAGADAALAATLFHDGLLAIPDLKAYLAAQGVPVRPYKS